MPDGRIVTLPNRRGYLFNLVLRVLAGDLTSKLAKPVDPLFFLPEAQLDIPDTDPGSHFLHDIVIVTKPGVSLSVAQVTQAMAAVDPNLPVISIRPLSEQVTGVFRQQRLIARLTSLFGILSLLLACIGMNGVIAYNAGCRTMEIGVRVSPTFA